MSNLVELKMGGLEFKVKASRHARQRMYQRKVDEYAVVGSIIAMGPERLKELSDTEDDAMVIDKEKNLGVVFVVENFVVTIITVIQKKNIYVKENTQLFNI